MHGLFSLPAYLSVVYLYGRILDRLVRHEPARDIAYLLASGGLGLLLEWTLMGLSPWSNPAANPLLMLAFQSGMFAFWATVATAPRAFLDRREAGRAARQRILRFYVPYFVAVYAVGLSVPERWRFGTIILLILVGYSVVAGLLFTWAIGLDSRSPGARSGDAGPGSL